jgi:nitrogenase molybdenum-iron protein alpha chain
MFLKSKTAIIREKRLQTITAYYGKPDTLLEEYSEGQLAQRVRTFSQDYPSDMIYALKILTTVKEAAIIIHGAAGCGTGRLSFHLTDEINGNWAVTNLNERDSIMGSDAKLREAIKQIHQQYHPKIIFILSTPVVAINNDDIESVVEEWKEDSTVTVVPVYTDGFRSKTGVTGYDVVSHAIIKHTLAARKEEKSEFVNLLSVSEKQEDLEEISRMLHETGLSINLFPQYTSIENIRRLPEAAFSIAANPDEGDYPGVILEKKFNIPFLRPGIPVGIANTETWIAEIGKLTNHETQARQLIESEKGKLTAGLEKYPAGKRNVFVNLPPALAFAITGLLEELGYKVIGLKLPFFDLYHVPQIEKIRMEKSDFSLLVGDGQLFEEENALKKLQVGLYIGRGGDDSVAIRNGIPVVNIENLPVAGFKGALNLARKIIKTQSNLSFVQSLAGIETKTYIGNWLNKSPNWFIKQEVK